MYPKALRRRTSSKRMSAPNSALRRSSLGKSALTDPQNCFPNAMSDADTGSASRATEDEVSIQFPTEIYIEIISYVSSKDDLRNLALVCRLFSSFVTPQLFRRISIQLDPSKWLDSTSKFYRALDEYQDPLASSLCVHVRECTLQSTPFCGEPSIHSFARHINNLLRMPNLNALALHLVYLTPDIFSQLSQLSGLTSLAFLKCHVGDKLSNRDIISLAAHFRLESFLLDILRNSREDGPGYKDFAPFVTNSCSLTLSIDSIEFISHLATQRIIPLLHSLTLNSLYDHKLFFEILKSFPSLVDLQLYCCTWPEDPDSEGVVGLSKSKTASRKKIDFAFSLSHLPNLRRLTCPIQYAYLLAGPHSLEEISFHPALSVNEIEWHDFFDDESLHLAEGMRLLFDGPNGNLRRLKHLHRGLVTGQPGVKWYGRMQQWFPQLESLDFWVELQDSDVQTELANGESPTLLFRRYEPELRQILEQFIDTWGPLKTLQQVHFHVMLWNLREISIERGWLRDILTAHDFKYLFPDLSKFIFKDIVYSRAQILSL
ncbi:hypothetical protein D9757_000500 [Collybiopsis confluens]|uniref:F-box domain-containing protein n=1 Tax=Collybiopsis confluens TaxID=2823264 RepID=A0A8H5I1M1_9AGAR|nr:hypothetical protein D9757_000500 [Collybiopsis confluens]